MSATLTLTSAPTTRSNFAQQPTRSAFATSVIDSLNRSDKWSSWLDAEPRLAGFGSLEDALEGWRRRDVRLYQVVAGLAALGSRRGGDDDDAALAVVVLLEDGVNRVATQLSDLCELDDVKATVWAEVKAAEPQLGNHAARYLLQRARQRLSRPAAGMVSRFDTIPLEHPGETQDRVLRLAAPEVEDPLTDLADLLEWATGVGVIADDEADLIVELLAAENGGMAREEAQRLAGERRGVAMRTVRRRRDATTARLREAAASYLAATA